MDKVTFIFILMLVYKFKHFIADYPLQANRFMLGKFLPDSRFIIPLLAHVSVHGAFTLVICIIINPVLSWLALVDMGIHFAMDRIKAGPKYLGRFKSLSGSEYRKAYDITQNANDEEAIKKSKLKLRDNKVFWIALGFDQLVHGLTDLLIVYALVVL